MILLAGWPETAEAYTEMFPALTEQRSTLAIDPPDLGDSDVSKGGYDTEALSRPLEEFLRPIVGDGKILMPR